MSLAIGTAIGAMMGIALFDNPAIGIGVGIALGMAGGAIWDSSGRD